MIQTMFHPQDLTVADPRMGTIGQILRRIPLNPCPVYFENIPLMTF